MYNVGATSSTLVQHCTNVIQMFYVYCVTFTRHRSNVFDVGPTLYKCYRNVFCLLYDIYATSARRLRRWSNIVQMFFMYWGTYLCMQVGMTPVLSSQQLSAPCSCCHGDISDVCGDKVKLFTSRHLVGEGHSRHYYLLAY